MKVRINGNDTELAEGATVAEALDEIGSPSLGVAVALDGAVVPRGSWVETTLREGATLEVLTAVQGG